jgi:hypothetical protein
MPDTGPGQDPPQLAAGRQGNELVPLGRADVETVRRPRCFVVGAEVSPRAVRGDDPDTALRRDEHAALGREREQRRLGLRDPDDLLRPDRLANVGDDGPAGRAERCNE